MVANLPIEEWHAVHQRLGSIARRRALLDAEEARCLRDAERIQLWRRLGYVHMGEYLERELGYSPHVAGERMRIARALAELPELESALGGGSLHYSTVRELSRVATRETEAEWLAAVRGKNLRQVEVAIAGRKRGDRPGDPARPELVNRILRLELSPDVFALFRQVQAALADELGGRLDDNAFVQAMCRRVLEGSGTGDGARPAHQICLTVCDMCKRGWQNGAGREIEVGHDVVERAQCDAELLGSVDAAQPARVTSTVTPRMRRQVLARDQHRCTVPGCRSSRNLDVHHIEYQRDGGRHEMGNLTALCAAHHQRLHEGALTIHGRAPDGLEYVWRTPAAPASELAQSHEEAKSAAPAPSVATSGERLEGSERDAISVTPPIARSSQPASAHVGPDASAAAPCGTVTVEARAPKSIEAGSEVSVDAPRGTVTVEVSAQPLMNVGPEVSAVARRGTVSVDAIEQCQFHVGPWTNGDASKLRMPNEGVDADQPHAGAASGACTSTIAIPAGVVGSDLLRMGACATTIVDGGAPRPDRDACSSEAAKLGSSGALRRQVDRRSADIARDVCGALTTAGYKLHEARRAVEQARSHVGVDATLEQLLREALRCCAHAAELHSYDGDGSAPR